MATANVQTLTPPDETVPRSRLRTITLILIVFGLFVSGYLSYVKLSNVEMVCIEGSVFNCDKVQASPIGILAGIPIAVWGFFMYSVIGFLTLFQRRIPFLQKYGMLFFFGIVVFSWVYSMWLVFAQFFVIQALCMWCLMHEANYTILFIITLIRMRRYMRGDQFA